jgi:ankyrin repeat protein
MEREEMRISSKIMLSMLIAGSTSFVAFGMEKLDLSNTPDEQLKQVCLQAISKLDLNNYNELRQAVNELEQAFAELYKKRRVATRFIDFLTTQKIAEILFEQGLRPMDTYDIDGNTLLHMAAHNGDTKVAKVLMEAVPEGAKRDEFIMKKNKAEGASAPDTELTALHVAVIERHAEIAKILIEFVSAESRAKFIEIKDAAGDTALDCAKILHRRPMTLMLLKYYKDLGLKS